MKSKLWLMWTKVIYPRTKMLGRHLFIVHKYMEEEMIPEDVIIATEEIEEAITINKEVDIKATRTIGNLSIWMTEEIISGILKETQWMHQKNKMQPLPFILQVWKVIEVIGAEGP